MKKDICNMLWTCGGLKEMVRRKLQYLHEGGGPYTYIFLIINKNPR